MDNIQSVSEYWNRTPCNANKGKEFEEGSLEFYEAIEKDRYDTQEYIHQFAQFSRWYGKDVLEIGCGTGTDALQFVRSGAVYEGIDASMHSVELTRKRFQIYGFHSYNSFRITQMNAEHMTFANNLFDLVYSWGVIHHSPNPQKVIDEIYRVLKPGGMFRGMMYRKISTMGFAVWIKDVKLHHNPFISLDTAFSRTLESPGTKAYSVNELKKMFKEFSGVKITVNFSPECMGLQNTSFLPLLKYYPNCLASWLCIEGIK